MGKGLRGLPALGMYRIEQAKAMRGKIAAAVDEAIHRLETNSLPCDTPGPVLAPALVFRELPAARFAISRKAEGFESRNHAAIHRPLTVPPHLAAHAPMRLQYSLVITLGCQINQGVFRTFTFGLLAAFPLFLTAGEGDLRRGAIVFKACAACHSVEPGRHLTGPSLAGVVGRKAGAAPGFLRYSEALRKSGIVWTERTLDAWLTDPAKLVLGNDMAFPGINDAKARRDLIAYLKASDSIPRSQRSGRRLPDLKKAQPEDLVTAIRHCSDTYFVTTGDGKLYKIWEFNLRFKSDTSDSGPSPGKPVIAGAGMRGDRAFIVFSSPEEFGRFIKSRCD